MDEDCISIIVTNLFGTPYNLMPCNPSMLPFVKFCFIFADTMAKIC